MNRPAIYRVSAFLNAAVVMLVLAGVFIVFDWNQMPAGLGGFLAMRITIKNLLVALVCLTGGGAAFHVFGLTKPAFNAPFRTRLVRAVKASSVAAAFGVLFPLTSDSRALPTQTLVYFLPVATVACVCATLMVCASLELLAKTLNGRRDLIIVGSGPRAESLHQRVRESSIRNTRILGFVDSPNGHHVSAEIARQMVGGLEELETILMKQPVDEVLIALPAKSCYAQIQTAIETCERAGVESKYFLPDIFELSLAKPTIESFGEASVVRLKVVQDDARLLVKRCIDIAGASLGLIVLGPLMLTIALAIKLTSPGPALFVQERYGLRKRLFRMYKFRTMVRDAERLQADLESQNEMQGPAFKIRKDPRITPIGRFLRHTSLDELPQLVNVLRGEMSLVGPRPLPIRDVSRFDNAALMRRFSVTPGLTCLWQINGRSNIDFDSWIKLDLQYIDEWSLGLDLKIIFKTVPSVLRTRGAV